MTLLYFDCFSGASGDMILGALIDAGVPFDSVRAALGSLAIDPDTTWVERVVRAGVSATKFRVRGEGISDDIAVGAHQRPHDHQSAHQHEEAHDRGHTHEHSHPRGHTDDDPGGGAAHHHGHRRLSDIYALIDGSALSGAGKDRAKALFARLGEAESAIHGTPIDQVHLHEVGALDSIIDIVGTVHAIESLGVERIMSSPLNVGSGTVRAAHGVYPVPAPATLALLANVPIYAGAQTSELVTPTGALLVSSYASSFGTIPAMRVRSIGYGAGSRDFDATPNVLRVLLGDAEPETQARTVVVIETEIDDMDPRIFGVLMEQLLGAGALDVFYTAIQMKKNRPGILVTIVAPPASREAVTAILFRESTTIGVRYREMARECLERDTMEVRVGSATVRIKVARRGGAVMNAQPEFDDCVRVAAEQGRPVKDVQAAATKAFLDSTR